MKTRLLYTPIVFVTTFCLLLAITSKSYSQTEISTNILESIWVAPDTILPIEATEITNSAEATTTIISEINKSLPDSSLLASYESTLADLLSGVDTLQNEIQNLTSEEMSARFINNYKNRLTLLQESLQSFKSQVENTTTDVQDRWMKEDYLFKTWELTLKSESSQELSESFLNRVKQVLQYVDEQKNELRVVADKLLLMGDQLLTANQTLDQLISQMNNAEYLFQRSYLEKTHPAIWERDTSKQETANPRKIITAFGKSSEKGLKEFYDVYSTKIYFHLAIFIILLILFISLKRNHKKWDIEEKNKKIKDIVNIIQKPLAVSLTLTLFLTFLLYPNSPVIIRDIAAFATIIPLIIVSRQVLSKHLHVFLYVICGIFLFEEIIETVKLESFPLPRIVILLGMLATTGYVVWLILQRRRKHTGAEKRKFKFRDLALWLSLIILMISIISNIIGYVSFGFFLFTGVIVAVVSALLIAVSFIVIEGFLNLIIMRNTSQMYDMVKDYGKMLVTRITTVVKILAIAFWVQLVLKRFLVYDKVLDWLESIFNSKWAVGEITISVNGILLFFLVIFLSIWLSKFMRLLLDKEIFPRVKLSRGVPGMINLILTYTMVTIGFLLSLGVLGINLDNLTILLGALGVGIGFGLQDVINNLISGFILVFERPIQVGDTVQFGTKEGLVKQIGIRASTIKTYDGSEVIVPNGKLVSQELINLTLSDPILRIEIDLGTEYGCEPQDVIDILVMQAKLHPDVTDSPEAFAIFFGFGDYELKFRLYAYTLEVNRRLGIRSELNLAIFQALKDAEIHIPYPIQNLNVNIDPTKKAKEL